MSRMPLIERLLRHRPRRRTIKAAALSERQLNDLGLSRLDLFEAAHRR